MIMQKTDQNVNLMYHLYSGALEDLGLQNIDHTTYPNIPRCLWDTDCEHYHLCLHELAWKQYCIVCVCHVLHSMDKLFPDHAKGSYDSLDALVWTSLNTNVVEVLTSMYCKLNLAQLLQACMDDHNEMNDIFIKYIKRSNKSHEQV